MDVCVSGAGASPVACCPPVLRLPPLPWAPSSPPATPSAEDASPLRRRPVSSPVAVPSAPCSLTAGTFSSLPRFDFSAVVSDQGPCPVPVSVPCLEICPELPAGDWSSRCCPARVPSLSVTVLCCTDFSDFKLTILCSVGLSGAPPPANLHQMDPREEVIVDRVALNQWQCPYNRGGHRHRGEEGGRENRRGGERGSFGSRRERGTQSRDRSVALRPRALG